MKDKKMYKTKKISFSNGEYISIKALVELLKDMNNDFLDVYFDINYDTDDIIMYGDNDVESEGDDMKDE